MEEDKDFSNEPTSGDWLHATIKGGISAVPILGGVAAEYFGMVIVPPASKRRDAWFQEVYERLRLLENRIAGGLHSLADNDEFLTAMLHATQIAVRTHQRAKIDALRNAVLNVASGTAPSSEHQLLFLAWVDTFTTTHLAFLRVCQAVPPQQLPEISSVRAKLGENREFTDAVVQDLRSRGLLIDHRAIAAREKETTTPLAILRWDLRGIAKTFLSFISEPNS